MMAGDGAQPILSAARAVFLRDREALLAAGRQEYDPAHPNQQPGLALLIGRQADAEAAMSGVYRIGSEYVSREEYLTRMGGRVIGHKSLDLLELYVSAGRWEELPPHKPYGGRDLLGASWRLHMAVLKAFIARDKKKIAAAIRKADKEGWHYLPYAIVCEAKRMGIDPKIKKFDF